MQCCDPLLKKQLDEARAAYHSLNTGTMPRVVVDQNGERVEFTAANRANLYRYVMELEAKCGTGAPVQQSRGPIGMIF